ncbi:MAG: CoB--CoM heterodisulfide reductase iron-sulfur subunit B family protein [Firmicutes bacterium]|nr:CoB--CoM heterodisulfide reductase iron-sulfur subunit B family protein [Bacillota bacterium]
MKLSYYPGCSLESTAKEYDISTRSVCEALGVKLVELKDWVCCGATSAHSTNHTLSVTLPARNIALAQEHGKDLAVPCSACYNILKKADYAMRNDGAMRSQTEKTVGFDYDGSISILSLLEAIVTGVGAEAIAGKVKKPLTGLDVVCYYGCLLVRPPDITQFDNSENPTSLDNIISSLGARSIPWSYKTDCCGASLSLTSPDIVNKMVGRLLDAAREAGASAIVTACPLCQSNLEMRRAKKDAVLPSFYFTELIGLALDLPGTDKWLKLHLIDPQPLLRSLSLQR